MKIDLDVKNMWTEDLVDLLSEVRKELARRSKKLQGKQHHKFAVVEPERKRN